MKKCFFIVNLVIFFSIFSYIPYQNLFFEIETKNFIILYPENKIDLAKKIANYSEEIYEKLLNFMQWKPFGKITIIITDHTDEINGMATTVYRKTIWIYTKSLDYIDELRDSQDPVYSLILHELTHIFHLDQVRGAAFFWKIICGNLYFPVNNAFTFYHEGITVYNESTMTQGGRLNSAYNEKLFLEMVKEELRTKKNIIDYQKLSNPINFYPYGSLHYYIGGKWTEYIIKKYGYDKYMDFLKDLSNDFFPFIFEFSIKFKKHYKKSFHQLWREWKEELHNEYIKKLDIQLDILSKESDNHQKNQIKQKKSIKSKKENNEKKENGNYHSNKNSINTYNKSLENWNYNYTMKNKNNYSLTENNKNIEIDGNVNIIGIKENKLVYSKYSLQEGKALYIDNKKIANIYIENGYLTKDGIVYIDKNITDGGNFIYNDLYLFDFNTKLSKRLTNNKRIDSFVFKKDSGIYKINNDFTIFRIRDKKIEIVAVFRIENDDKLNIINFDINQEMTFLIFTGRNKTTNYVTGIYDIKNKNIFYFDKISAKKLLFIDSNFSDFEKKNTPSNNSSDFENKNTPSNNFSDFEKKNAFFKNFSDFEKKNIQSNNFSSEYKNEYLKSKPENTKEYIIAITKEVERDERNSQENTNKIPSKIFERIIKFSFDPILLNSLDTNKIINISEINIIEDNEKYYKDLLINNDGIIFSTLKFNGYKIVEKKINQIDGVDNNNETHKRNDIDINDQTKMTDLNNKNYINNNANHSQNNDKNFNFYKTEKQYDSIIFSQQNIYPKKLYNPFKTLYPLYWLILPYPIDSYFTIGIPELTFNYICPSISIYGFDSLNRFKYMLFLGFDYIKLYCDTNLVLDFLFNNFNISYSFFTKKINTINFPTIITNEVEINPYFKTNNLIFSANLNFVNYFYPEKIDTYFSNRLIFYFTIFDKINGAKSWNTGIELSNKTIFVYDFSKLIDINNIVYFNFRLPVNKHYFFSESQFAYDFFGYKNFIIGSESFKINNIPSLSGGKFGEKIDFRGFSYFFSQPYNSNMVFYNKTGFDFLLYNQGFYFRFLTMGIKNISINIFSEEAYLFDSNKTLIGQGIEAKFNFSLYYGYLNILFTNGICYGYEIEKDKIPVINIYFYLDIFL